jgi:uncharacterized membrane protein YphA (DoxX/SURF4 family)
MLNVFPIQFLAPLAYALVRICLGIIFLRFGLSHIQNRESLRDLFSFSYFTHGLFFVWYVGIIEIILGGMLVLGFFTQIAALLISLLSCKCLILYKHLNHPLIPSRLSYTLILMISLSLLVTGAGIFAFDLPI